MLMFSSVPVVPVIPRQSLGWPGLTDMLVPAASLFLLPGLVVGFTFPGDWHKIRQMMEARREAEAEVISELRLTICRNQNFNRMTEVSSPGETSYLMMRPWKKRLIGTLSSFQQQLPRLPSHSPCL